MKTRKYIRIPKGWRRLRNGTIKRRGDCFLNCEGRWIETSDFDFHKVTPDYPHNYEYPDWTGIYIRKIKPR